jgi:two-component system LytT family sensor kinase
MNLPVKKYLLGTLIPLTVLSMYGFIVLLYAYVGMPLAAATTIATVATLSLVLVVWLLIIIINNYPTRVGIIAYAFFLATVLSIIISALDIAFLRWILSTPGAIREGWHATSNVLLAPLWLILNWLVCSWLATNAALRKKNKELQDKMNIQKDSSSLLKDAELYKLRQQLQPHFLYNSLNSINALTMMDPTKAQEMIGKLSDFLRSSVKREAQDLIPLDEELLYIEAYLSIESVRFGDRLHVKFDKEYTDDTKIPPFLLQPMLENAIKFGLYGNTGSVTITVNISLNDQMLLITITNPYDNDTTMPKGTGFGLKAIQRRLYLLYARNDLLETSQLDNIFTTTLKIPLQ